MLIAGEDGSPVKGQSVSQKAMRALLMGGVGMDLELVEREIPTPGAFEALVRIDAVGVCGSDLFLQKGGFGEDKLPRVPGHEAAGTVEAIGSGVTTVSVGDQVALYYITNSANPPRPNLGPGVVRMGVDVDGAFAEYVVRPESTLVPTATRIPPATLAVLTDAVATPYHALHSIGRVQPGERVAVIGIGGIGSNAVQLASVMGAHVVAISRSPGRRELALRLGAEAAMTLAEAQAEFGAGFDVVVQCAASADMDREAIGLATFAGRVVLVATTTNPFSALASSLVWRELEVRGSRGFTRTDIEAVIKLHASGKIQTDHLTDSIRPLAEGNLALTDLAEGRVLRAVLTP